jgi:hypothetical protein
VAGNDFWTYQRFAYRIVMQGYWLEGGSRNFYFQPFYRWLSGLLHLVFGDSSIGEFFWEGACYLSVALLAFSLTKASTGFRWGVLAAVTTLTVVAIGLPWGLIGVGLSEITSTGFIYLGAFMALRSRRGSLRWAVAAGLLASLAFYTRLNNLPMAAGIALFALSARVPLAKGSSNCGLSREANAEPATPKPKASRLARDDRVAHARGGARRSCARHRLLCLEKLALQRIVQCLWRHVSEHLGGVAAGDAVRGRRAQVDRQRDDGRDCSRSATVRLEIAAGLVRRRRRAARCHRRAAAS